MPTDYYNDNNRDCCDWLRSLIAAGHLPNGVVDERPIQEVQPNDLTEFRRCHFFAGIGGWPYALMLAGWPDDARVWTGSCPCQPFSIAGKHTGMSDERHLWPEFARLIGECKPPTVFGEQVSSPDGRAWLAAVRSDLEAMGYAVGAADLCAAGVGAPHIRQRLYFVAESDRQRQSQRCDRELVLLCECNYIEATRSREIGNVANAEYSERWPELQGHRDPQGRERPRRHGSVGGTGELGDSGWTRTDYNVWRDSDWIRCTDGRWRPVEPGTFPLADGVPARVGRLHGYGNAIVPQVAAAFIEAYMSVNDVHGPAYGTRV